jgi:hypothetical protein
MFFSVITAPIVLAQLIVVLALTYPFRHYKKFATLRLVVQTMPIYKAVASGNEFYRETTRSNLK